MIADVVTGCVYVSVTAETSDVCMLVIISVSSSSTDMNISAIPKLSGTSYMFTDSSCGCHSSSSSSEFTQLMSLSSKICSKTVSTDSF